MESWHCVTLVSILSLRLSVVSGGLALGALVLVPGPGGTGSAQQAEVAIVGPEVSEPTMPRVLDTSLYELSRTRIVRAWRPGDPVRVIPLEEVEPEYDAAAEDQDPQNQRPHDEPRDATRPAGAGPTISEPVTPRVEEADLRDPSRARTVRRWQPGDPVRVVPQGVGPEYDSADAAAVLERAPRAFSQLADFDGIPATGFLPPDTVGDVGPDHYVQMVNTAFAIYDKQGNLLAGPSPINSLWSGFGGPCEVENHGDPIVQYDHLADRWLLSQFAVPGGAAGFHECIAISRGPNPVTDGWYLYDFQTPVFPDYPKIGVWPDAYYMSTYEGTNLGVFAFDRARMLNGDPATFVRFTLPSIAGISPRARTRILPSDLEGPNLPPAGTPNYFIRSIDGVAQGGGADRLEIFEFHVDFANPAASTFTGPTNLPTMPFDIQMCGSALPRSCIPQPDTTERLDPLSNRLMRRAQYRSFGDYEAIVVGQAVDVNESDRAGMRWYELRQVGGAWSIHQQGTHAPDDEIHRWMGGLAMDQDGNIALGYSVSGRQEYPGIRYAARSAADPPGTLPIGEVTLVTGAGSQTHPSARWGDYPSMNVDPDDDCTFWFTTEYYDNTSSAGWKTRVSSFKNPSCGVVEEQFEYTAKLVCGLQKDPENMRLARGFYATAINIHNPQEENVSFSKKLALTFPPDEQKPGEVRPIAKDELGPDEALEVDCIDIQRRLYADGFPPPGYIKGFVVIRSRQSLDVTAVYTAAGLDRAGRGVEHSSIDVEQVHERRIGQKGTLADLVPVPGPSGHFCERRDGKLILTIKNQGPGPSGSSQTEVDFFSHGRAVIPTPALARNGTAALPVDIPPRCFDSDCEFRITADVMSEVVEADEGNNSADDLCLG